MAEAAEVLLPRGHTYRWIWRLTCRTPGLWLKRPPCRQQESTAEAVISIITQHQFTEVPDNANWSRLPIPVLCTHHLWKWCKICFVQTLAGLQIEKWKSTTILPSSKFCCGIKFLTVSLSPAGAKREQISTQEKEISFPGLPGFKTTGWQCLNCQRERIYRLRETPYKTLPLRHCWKVWISFYVRVFHLKSCLMAC